MFLEIRRMQLLVNTNSYTRGRNSGVYFVKNKKSSLQRQDFMWYVQKRHLHQ